MAFLPDNYKCIKKLLPVLDLVAVGRSHYYHYLLLRQSFPTHLDNSIPNKNNNNHYIEGNHPLYVYNT